MREVSPGADRETLPVSVSVSARLSSLMMLVTFLFLRADELPSYIFVGTEITLVCCMLMLEEKHIAVLCICDVWDEDDDQCERVKCKVCLIG